MGKRAHLSASYQTAEGHTPAKENDEVLDSNQLASPRVLPRLYTLPIALGQSDQSIIDGCEGRRGYLV